MNYLKNLLSFAPSFDPAAKPIIDAMNIVLPIILTLVGALGVIRCIYIGVAMANAEDASKREEAKKKLLWAIIGYVLIFVLIAVLWAVNPLLISWLGGYESPY